VRAGCIAILAAANYKRQKNALSLASLGFNLFVLLLGVSVTTIMAYVGALAAGVIFRKNPLKSLAALAALFVLAWMANVLNQANGSSDIFDFILHLNTHFVPKVDIYRQYFAEMIGQYPWLPFFGNGFGNAMNRFALLPNFQGSANFPGKDLLALALDAPLVQRHLVEYYDLNNGVAGNSIISTPWSGLTALVFEWGAVGLAFGTALAWPALKSVWRAGSGTLIGSGKFLLVFLAGNLFWDCYLDYPELMIPFFVCALAMVGLERRQA
jgi:hypothetical protein